MKRFLTSAAAVAIVSISLVVIGAEVFAFGSGLYELLGGKANVIGTDVTLIRAAVSFAAAIGLTALLAGFWKISGIYVPYFSVRRALLLAGGLDWLTLAVWTAMWCFIFPRHGQKFLLGGWLFIFFIVLFRGFLALVRWRTVHTAPDDDPPEPPSDNS